MDDPTCAHDGCITCSDAAIPVKVLSIDGDDALCEDDRGTRTVVATELVAPVGRGETLLTHGGVAIARLESDRREAPC